MIEMNSVSPNKNSRPPERIHKTGNKHHTNIKKKEKHQTKTSYCNYRNTQQYCKHTEQHG